MTDSRHLFRPAMWTFSVLIVFEFVFMISPLALQFYSAYTPWLNALRSWPGSAWLTQFYLPHFSITSSPTLNQLKPVGFALVAAGLVLFLVAAVPVYVGKLRRSGAVTGGLYRFVRHPQYTAFALAGLGTSLIWARYLVLMTFVSMLVFYCWLARREERECLSRFGAEYAAYRARTGMFLPRLFANSLPQRLGDRLPRRRWPAAALWATAWVAAIVVALLAANGVRDLSLARVSTYVTPTEAVLSPALLESEELRLAFRLTLADTLVADLLQASGGSSRALIAWVVPADWYLPDLPLQEIVDHRGHATPLRFDRSQLRVLLARPRTTSRQPAGLDIIRSAYGIHPVAVALVDMRSGSVSEVGAASAYVLGDFPAPLF